MRQIILCFAASLGATIQIAVADPVSISSPGFSNGSFIFWVQTKSDFNTGYIVEYKQGLQQTNWTSLTSFLGTGALVKVTDPAPVPSQRFYRVRLVVI